MPTMLGLTNSPSKHGVQGSNAFNGTPSDVNNYEAPKKPKERNTIAKRNLADAIDCETLLWRALCDEPDSALEYMAADCIVIDPVTFGTNVPIKRDQLEERMRQVAPWTSYRIHKDTRVVTQIGLMSMAVMSCLTLYRMGKSGQEETNVVTSSVWRETAGAEWEVCSLLVGYAD